MKKILKAVIPRKIIILISRLINGNYSFIFSCIPIKPNKVVVCNFYGNGYGDNIKYIVEELMRCDHKFDIVWLLKKELYENSLIPTNVRLVEYKSIKALYELASSKIWIDNTRKTFYPPKKKEQFYIQTWHGGIPLKQIEKDVENKLSEYYLDNAKRDSRIANLFISDSKFCTELYKNSFWYNGEILEIGSPRCDILYKNCDAINEKVKMFFSLNKDDKIILYAPTFREDGNLSVYNIEFDQLINKVEKKFGGKWKVLIRLHPNIAPKAQFIKYNVNVINATLYEDMYELLSMANILITDYSSSMFEFAISQKPVFLYCNDLKEYSKERNFYFKIENIPFPVAENNTQLMELVECFSADTYSNAIEEFDKITGVVKNGNASQVLAEHIYRIITDDVFSALYS